MLRALTLALLSLSICSCVTTETNPPVSSPPPPGRRDASAESGRGIPYFSRYERNAIKPSPHSTQSLTERKNGLPAFHDYQKVREWTCVAAGTKILSDRGPVMVECVEVGMRVIGYDPERGLTSVATVQSVESATRRETVVVNGSLRLTGEHPVFADAAWVQAGQLRIGSHLRTSAGALAEVRRLERLIGSVTVFSLRVDAPHTFFADGYLVHNKPPPFRR